MNELVAGQLVYDLVDGRGLLDALVDRNWLLTNVGLSLSFTYHVHISSRKITYKYAHYDYNMKG